MFNRMFDTDGNKIVDKFEVLAVICFVSGLTNTEKVGYQAYAPHRRHYNAKQ